MKIEDFQDAKNSGGIFKHDQEKTVVYEIRRVQEEAEVQRKTRLG